MASTRYVSFSSKTESSKIESVLCCNRRSIGQSVLEQSTHLGLMTRFFYYLTVAGLLMWGVLSDERTGLSFPIAAGLCQRSHSRARVPWDSPPYFTVSDSRLPFSSPPTTCRDTLEVFDTASTRESSKIVSLYTLYSSCVNKM
jgi:hypothetical protein